MKITEKKLRRLIRSVIKEATGGFSLQGASRRYLKGVTKQGDKFTPVKSPKTKSRQSKYDHYKSLTIQHQANRPTPVSKTIIQSQPDTTRWIHPQSGVTATLGQGETQPKKGWQYRQATTTPGKTDTSKWIHPFKVGDTGTALSKGQTKPDLGWAYDTQARTGYTSPVEPGKVNKFRSYALDPKQVAPTHGWGVKGKLGQTTYHHGSQKQYTAQKLLPGQKKGPALPVTLNYSPKKTKVYGQGDSNQYQVLKNLSDMGKGTWAGPLGQQSGLTGVKKTSHPKGPDVTSYATQYGQGSLSDYSTAQAGSGRDQWAIGDTTNPNVDVEVDNPAYDDYVTADAEWEQQNQDLEQSAQDAYDDWQQHTQSDTQGSMPDAPPQGGGGGQGGGPSKGGGGSGKGKGGGRGKGKGKGKGKKGKKKRKDENLNLLKQEVNEIVKSLTLINKENKKWQS